jgi:hypothetical protein
MSMLIDSYSESNATNGYILTDSPYIEMIGQSFRLDKSYKLTSVKFYLENWNGATGNAEARLYAHTGTFGNYGKPTGSVLATSDVVDISTISEGGLVLTELSFSGANQYIMEDGDYCIGVFYSSGTYNADVNLADGLVVAVDTTGEHEGNTFYFDEGFVGYAVYDTCFYLYGELQNPTAQGISSIQGVSSVTL